MILLLRLATTMDDITRKRLERRLRAKLSPGTITCNLLQASLFLMAYELLKSEVIQKTKGFFFEGFENNNFRYSPRYSSDVLALDPKNAFRASCLWLASVGALADGDVEIVESIRQQRNTIAHELPRILMDPDADIDFGLFAETHRLIASLGRFWGRVQVDTDSQFDGQAVADEDIQSGSMVLMDHILSILRGQEA